jgi:hypothetical protein
MLDNPVQVISEFVDEVTKHYPHINIAPADIKYERLSAPHCHPKIAKRHECRLCFYFNQQLPY